MLYNLNNTQQQELSAVNGTSIFEQFNNVSANQSDYNFISNYYESMHNNSSSSNGDSYLTWGEAILFAISTTAFISIVGCCSVIACPRESSHTSAIYSKLEML